MINSLFSLFAPFPELTVVLFTKEDAIMRDEQVLKALGGEAIAGLHQMHENRTIRVNKPLARNEQADGMVTDTKNLILTVRTADCQPFIAYAPKHGVIGVLHVGWRGLIAGAIPSFFDVLKEEWRIEPNEMLVAAGPSLCRECADFSDPETELFPLSSSFMHGKNVDLQDAADAQLSAMGVERLERSQDCTRCHPEVYWTYRGGDREEVREGKTNVLACVLKG